MTKQQQFSVWARVNPTYSPSIQSSLRPNNEGPIDIGEVLRKLQHAIWDLVKRLW